MVTAMNPRGKLGLRRTGGLISEDFFFFACPQFDFIPMSFQALKPF